MLAYQHRLKRACTRKLLSQSTVSAKLKVALVVSANEPLEIARMWSVHSTSPLHTGEKTRSQKHTANSTQQTAHSKQHTAHKYIANRQKHTANCTHDAHTLSHNALEGTAISMMTISSSSALPPPTVFTWPTCTTPGSPLRLGPQDALLTTSGLLKLPLPLVDWSPEGAGGRGTRGATDTRTEA